MTKRDKKQAARKDDQTHPTEPIDVIDGIPDRQAERPRWKLLTLAGVFLAWIAFMLYCQLAGEPPK